MSARLLSGPASAAAPTDGPPDLFALEPGRRPGESELAECIADEHPSLLGRVLCRFPGTSAPARWIPCLRGVRPRTGDRVLVLQVMGTPHGVVAGLLSSLESVDRPESRVARTRRLRPDESVIIENDEGTPVVEVRSDERGAVVRLLASTSCLEARGALSIEADALALRARKGNVEVSASDDVVVLGERIELN